MMRTDYKIPEELDSLVSAMELNKVGIDMLSSIRQVFPVGFLQLSDTKGLSWRITWGPDREINVAHILNPSTERDR